MSAVEQLTLVTEQLELAKAAVESVRLEGAGHLQYYGCGTGIVIRPVIDPPVEFHTQVVQVSAHDDVFVLELSDERPLDVFHSTKLFPDQLVLYLLDFGRQFG